MRYFNLIRSFRNWPDYLFYKWGKRTGKTLVFKMRSGISMEVPAQLMVEFKEIFFSECYGRNLDGLHEVGTVVHIGANIGFFTLFAANVFPDAQIHSYEPVPANFKQRQANVARNPEINVRARQNAVGGGEGTLSLHLNGADRFTTSASLVRDAGGQTIEVQCLSLASVINNRPDGKCDFLKVDCEGAEYGIFYESDAELFRGIRHIAMEYHHCDDERQNMTAMISFLKNRGFAVHTHGNMVYANASRG